MTRLATTPGRLTEQRALALATELDRLQPADAEQLTPHERATYRRAIDLAPITPRRAAALRLALTL